MKKRYYIQWYGYECCGDTTYATLKEARKELREGINDDIANYRGHNKLCKIRHSANSYETRNGSRQGYNIYSKGYICEA
jgi:hypothetical protein